MDDKSQTQDKNRTGQQGQSGVPGGAPPQTNPQQPVVKDRNGRELKQGGKVQLTDGQQAEIVSLSTDGTNTLTVKTPEGVQRTVQAGQVESKDAAKDTKDHQNR